MNLASLVYDLRALGVRSLSIELDEPPQSALSSAPPEFHTSPAPPPEPETKLETQCAFPGCGDDKAGLFGGSVGAQFCRKHAAQRAGART